MCRVQDALSNHDESDETAKDPSIAQAAYAHKTKRLSFAWLDGEVQNVSICHPELYLLNLSRFVSPESIRMS